MKTNAEQDMKVIATYSVPFPLSYRLKRWWRKLRRIPEDKGCYFHFDEPPSVDEDGYTHITTTWRDGEWYMTIDGKEVKGTEKRYGSDE